LEIKLQNSVEDVELLKKKIISM
jgi:hypothetical protein